jgi:hypothetical protein
MDMNNLPPCYFFRCLPWVERLVVAADFPVLSVVVEVAPSASAAVSFSSVSVVEGFAILEELLALLVLGVAFAGLA